MKIAITSDHAGFQMKILVNNYLREKKIPITRAYYIEHYYYY